MSKNLIIVIFCFLFLCCRGESNDCKNSYQKAKINLNKYYEDRSSSHLDSALYYANQLSACTEYKVRAVNLKITVYTLLKKYEMGCKYLDSLNVTDFSLPYQKTLYMKTFEGLSFEQRDDYTKRNACYKEIVAEIERYLNTNPLNKNAIADLFYTKLKYEEKKVVINEINLMQSQKKNDKEFFDALKETINAME